MRYASLVSRDTDSDLVVFSIDRDRDRDRDRDSQTDRESRDTEKTRFGGSDDATTNKGAWFGKQGWVAPIEYEFNNHGKFYGISQDDSVELTVDMTSEEGELSFIVNNRKMPNRCDPAALLSPLYLEARSRQHQY